MSQTASKTRTKTVSEVRNVAVSFEGKLDTGESLSAVATPTELTTSDLSFASEAVSATALTIDGVSVPAGEAVTFKVSGGVAGTTYTIQLSATTDSTPAQTVRGRVTLYVEAD